MSLVTCPDCGKDVSDRATCCPNCGCPVEAAAPEVPRVTVKSVCKKYIEVAVWICLLTSIFLVFYYAGNNRKGPVSTSQPTPSVSENAAKQEEKPAKPAIAQQKSIDDHFIKENDYGLFQAIIESAGLVCHTCEGGHILGFQEYGQVFRVYCNGNALVYKVTVSENGKAFVKPWKDD